MIDYAMQGRREWIKSMSRKMQPTFGLLHHIYSPRGDASVDQEYQRRAERAWEQTRSIGRAHG